MVAILYVMFKIQNTTHTTRNYDVIFQKRMRTNRIRKMCLRFENIQFHPSHQTTASNYPIPIQSILSYFNDDTKSTLKKINEFYLNIKVGSRETRKKILVKIARKNY